MIDEDYKKAGFFAIESHSEDEATRDQVYTRRWIFAPISSILLLCNVYGSVNNCSSRAMQLNATQLNATQYSNLTDSLTNGTR